MQYLAKRGQRVHMMGEEMDFSGIPLEYSVILMNQNRGAGPGRTREEELKSLNTPFMNIRPWGMDIVENREQGVGVAVKKAPQIIPGKRTDGVNIVRKRFLGMEFVGKRAPGMEFIGKRVPGMEFVGK